MASKFANNGTLSLVKRAAQLRYDAKKFYGITREQAVALRSGTCQICSCRAKKMCIDHIIPGTYRGVLCQQCNVRLGWFEKREEDILNYLKRGSRRGG